MDKRGEGGRGDEGARRGQGGDKVWANGRGDEGGMMRWRARDLGGHRGLMDGQR